MAALTVVGQLQKPAVLTQRGMSAHPRVQAIMGSYTTRLGLAGVMDQAGTADCVRK